ncbi:LOW QUALITY PROTEIN: solute carrier family 49 member A3-like [Babylonia areolata]|uniref:LOW QUALITY PROTEIN: solute carrier family 49 member A3-like n=1 Tax=Babylonia areolata TaxID=304850 RepID=UPI003FD177F8
MATIEASSNRQDSTADVFYGSTVNHYQPQTQKEYTLYTRRWFIVFVVCIINIANAMIWICFSPVTNHTTDYYNISADEVNWLSLVYVVASIPFGLLATWLLDTLGLRTSIILAAWLNLIGSGLRNLTTFDFLSSSAKYPVLMCGQFLAACAQPFIMFVPTKLAALWFPDTQRALANTLASMANPLGIMIANLMSPNIVKSTSDLPTVLWVCTGVAGLGTVLATFGVCSSRPPTPPTASAAEGTQTFFLGLKQLRRVKSYWVLFMVFGSGLALFTAFTTFLEQILCPRGYSNTFSGLCGALLIVCGTVGAGVFGAIVDKTKRFEEVSKACYVVGLVGGIIFTEISRYRNNEVIIAISIGVFGFFGFGAYPVCMEMAVEITYPVAEATSSGLLFISGQIQGLIYMVVAQMIAQPLSAAEKKLPNACGTGSNSTAGGNSANFTPQDWTVPGLFLDGMMTFFTIIFLLCFRPVYRRLLAERIAQDDRRVLSQSVETLTTETCEEERDRDQTNDP